MAVGSAHITDFFDKDNLDQDNESSEGSSLNESHQILESEESDLDNEQCQDAKIIEYKDKKKGNSSKIITMIHEKGSYRAQFIRRWATLCLKDNAIPPSFQGKHLSKFFLHDEDNNDKARVIIALDANKDGYWNGAIRIWAFDNSTIHMALAPDALNIKKMNMHSGGAQPKMRTTKWNSNDQEMGYPLNHPTKKLRGQPKEIKVILEERGLWRDGLLANCERCKKKEKGYTKAVDCYARRILANQPDFVNKRGAAKVYTRQKCDYSWTGLRHIEPEALDSVPVE
ncbi:12814_t:CDS:2, partial [Gigaspora margarita]